MKLIIATRICIAMISAVVIPQFAQAQVPPIVDTTAPVVPKGTSSTDTAAVSKLAVRCQDFKTVVTKGEQQAVMMTWTTNYFGKEFTSAKRCQIVSEKLQKAANLNGGTFKGLELASGTVNYQTVICALPNGSKKCDANNMLFTLKPENATNPEAVMKQILTFAEDGSTSVEESTKSGRSKVDFNLGHWEQKAFKVKRPSATNSNRVKTGF
jgi:Circadian oscillating protein COP23